jgi:hypothetical protein
LSINFGISLDVDIGGVNTSIALQVTALHSRGICLTVAVLAAQGDADILEQKGFNIEHKGLVLLKKNFHIAANSEFSRIILAVTRTFHKNQI